LLEDEYITLPDLSVSSIETFPDKTSFKVLSIDLFLAAIRYYETIPETCVCSYENPPYAAHGKYGIITAIATGVFENDGNARPDSGFKIKIGHGIISHRYLKVK